LAGARPADVEIFMQAAATQRQLGNVRSYLVHSRDVVVFAFLDKQAELREFNRIFRNDPDLLNKVNVDKLPTSFRVQIRKTSRIRALVSRTMRLAGVDMVENLLRFTASVVAGSGDRARLRSYHWWQRDQSALQSRFYGC
jgi:cell division protein FtsX